VFKRFKGLGFRVQEVQGWVRVLRVSLTNKMNEEEENRVV
jgi:hypothetical protein